MTADDIPYITDEPETRPQWSGRSDLHARIKAAVDEWRELVRLSVLMPPPWRAFVLAMCDHADDVLARHRPVKYRDHARCSGCTEHWLCPDVRALATAWLGDGWDQ